MQLPRMHDMKTRHTLVLKKIFTNPVTTLRIPFMGNPQLARAELTARLKNALNTRENWAPGTPRIPSMELVARRSYASMPLAIGQLKTLLGEPDEARKFFLEAAELSEREAFEPPPDLGMYDVALEGAIIGGDRASAVRISSRRGEASWKDAFLRDRKAYAYGLPCLVAGDADGLRPHLEAARGIEPKKAWYTGLVELMDAVAARDQAALGSALELVLKDHHAKSCRRSQIWNSIGSFVCVPATVLAILARWAGLEIPAALPSRRALLKNLLIIGLTEFGERPLEKGASFELEVDYLPPALIP